MTIDKQALREAAICTGGQEWEAYDDFTVIVKGTLEEHESEGWVIFESVADDVIDKNTTDFIAVFCPATALALLDELEDAEKRGDKISLDYDTLADEANIIAEQRDELIIRNHEMAELLINLKKARPGGVYFNKWDTQIANALNAAGIGKGN